jgi:hypothetical protein
MGRNLLILLFFAFTLSACDTQNGAADILGNCNDSYISAYDSLQADASAAGDPDSVANAQAECNSFFQQYGGVSCSVSDGNYSCGYCSYDYDTNEQDCDCSDGSYQISSSDLSPLCAALANPVPIYSSSVFSQK